MEYALVVEKERERALRAERTSVLVEVGADVGHGALVVVGGGFHHDCYSVGAVSFVDDFLVVAGILLGGFLDGAFDGVFGHVGGLCVLHQHAEPRVHVGVCTAGLRGHGYFFADAGERAAHVAPTLEFAGFTVFKCSSHCLKKVVCVVFFDCSVSGVRLRVRVAGLP